MTPLVAAAADPATLPDKVAGTWSLALPVPAARQGRQRAPLPRCGRPRPWGHRRDLRGGSDGTGTEPVNVVTVPSQVSDVKKGVSRPVGRVLCARLRGAAVIHLGLPLPAASCGLPAGIGRAALNRSRREPLAPLLTLLRVGFTEPPQSPAALVVSYTTVSPLPRGPRARGAVCFLWHCPAGHPGSALPTTLPCGARTFLTGPKPGATARPTHPRPRIRRPGAGG